MDALSGRVAVVTGGAAGIGRTIARRLADRGARVVAADLDSVLGASDGTEAGITHLPVDVTDPASVDDLMARVRDEHGRVDVLVNNAGIFSSLTPTPFTELEPDDWRRVLDVNVVGLFTCCKAAVPVLAPGGRIVNIASAAALKGLPMFLHYVSSKGAVLAMTRALARELADRDVRVNAVAPGFTLSDAVRDNEDLIGGLRESAVQTRLLHRDQVPDDVAGVVCFLAGDDADFITGQTFVVDGGSVLH
ncbi:MAG: SDR family oxidoreductase [Streptosporangiales bacterium]|nr:SDR family oxidoreductase [Streptosporangiales bacterium]